MTQVLDQNGAMTQTLKMRCKTCLWGYISKFMGSTLNSDLQKYTVLNQILLFLVKKVILTFKHFLLILLIKI